MADVTGVMPHFTVVGEEPAALVMTLSAPFDTSRGLSPNPSFEALLTAFVMRDMVFLPTR